jgi:hypothetical protein
MREGSLRPCQVGPRSPVRALLSPAPMAYHTRFRFKRTCVPAVVLVAAFSYASAASAAPRQAERVEIKGTLVDGSWIEARRIRLRDPDRGSKVEGTLISIDAKRRRLDIGGLTVALAPDALIQRDDGTAGTLEDVQVGHVVEAKGKWNGRSLDASRLRLRPPDAVAIDDLEIEADVEWNETGHFRVFGYPVGLAAAGKVADERAEARTPLGDITHPAADRLRRDVDDQAVEPIRVGNWLTLGGRIGGDMWNAQQLAVDPDARERQSEATTMAQMLGSVRLGRHVEFYAKAGASGGVVLEPALSQQRDVRLYEAHLALGSTAPFGVQVGRQRFRDDREWFFDDYLDAMKVFVQTGRWRAEAAVADSPFAGPRELRSRAEQRHVIASLKAQIGTRSDAAGFVIARDDRNRRERPMWTGGQWNGRIPKYVKSWALGAVRRGESETGRLGGWAFDAGAAVRLPVRGALALGGGYAAATGDTSAADGVDTRFRQTGLDDNRSRLFGVKRFARYGEVLDPELSNLNIWTITAGLRPWSRTSIDVAYHQYIQRSLRRSLMSNRLDAIGTGRSTALGDELDFVLAIQQWSRAGLSLTAGVFRPGEAIIAPARPVVYVKPELRVFF